MFAGANNLYFGILGVFLFSVFVLVTLLERINDLEKDFNRKLSDYNSVILMRINETHNYENKRDA
jgi:hypothetical protein